jgi:hypothetical protein
MGGPGPKEVQRLELERRAAWDKALDVTSELVRKQGEDLAKAERNLNQGKS